MTNSREGEIVEHLAAIRQHLAAIQEEQRALHELLARVVPAAGEASGNGPPALPHADSHQVLAECGRDIVGVLRAAGHPLTTLEILDELVRRQTSWRENLVRHALTTLADEGVVRDRSDVRPHSYALATKP